MNKYIESNKIKDKIEKFLNKIGVENIDIDNIEFDILDYLDSLTSEFEIKFKITSITKNNGRILSGRISFYMEEDIVKCEFTTNPLIIEINYTSLLDDDEVLDYIQQLDQKEVDEIVNPMNVLDSRVDIPITKDSYRYLSTTYKEELKDKIKLLTGFKRNLQINKIIK